METVYPFGSKLKKVEQQDKSSKKVFVLGVNASAVHAKWIDADGNVKVNALPVASEPYIFWNGDNADQIIKDIQIPSELGKLIPLNDESNAPLGKVVDELYLEPLEYKRDDVWFCNLIPYSRLNQDQEKAIEANYKPLVEVNNLTGCTIPVLHPSEFENQSRLGEILAELEQSQADTILLLGDLTIKHFLSHFTDFQSLSDFTKDFDDLGKLVYYGKTYKINIAGKQYNVIPLTHPRPDLNFKSGGIYWNEFHEYWLIKRRLLWGQKILTGKDPSLVTKKPVKCPVCGESGEMASYKYIKPPFSEETKRKIKEGKIILKDFPITDDDPKYVCLECRHEFYKIQN